MWLHSKVLSLRCEPRHYQLSFPFIVHGQILTMELRLIQKSLQFDVIFSMNEYRNICSVIVTDIRLYEVIVKSVSPFFEHVLFNLMPNERRECFHIKQRHRSVACDPQKTIIQINITKSCGVEFRTR